MYDNAETYIYYLEKLFYIDKHYVIVTCMLLHLSIPFVVICHIIFFIDVKYMLLIVISRRDEKTST